MTSALAPTGSMAPEDAPEAPESALNLGHASKSNFGPELIGLADEENVRLTKRPTVRNKAWSPPGENEQKIGSVLLSK